MKCSFCGNELEPGTGFCPSCGTLNSFDNNFERPKETEEKSEPVAKKQSENDVYSEPITIRESTSYKAFDNIGAVPEYVSPVFEEKELPKQEAPKAEPTEEPKVEPKAEPKEESKAEEKKEAPIVEKPVAVEPMEEVEEEAEDESEAENEKLDDMYVGSSKGKKKKVIIPILALLLVAAIVGGVYGAKNDLFKPEVSNSTEDNTGGIPVVNVTDESDTSESESSSSEEASTDDTSESEESTSETTEPSTSESTTDESTTEESTTEAPIVTAPSTTASTTNPITTKPTTTKPTTTKPVPTKPVTTKPSTTKPITTKPATTKPSTTVPTTVPTTKPTPAKPTPAKPTPTKPSSTTLQKPKKPIKQYPAFISENGVAMRYAPSKSSPNRVSLSIGADVVVSGEENGFVYVYSNRYSISGWVSKAYVSDKRPVADKEQKVSGLVNPDKTYSNPELRYVTPDDGLRLRKGPGTDYDIIRNVGKGYPVAVKGESTSAPGWLYVTDITRGITGWVMGSYLD